MNPMRFKIVPASGGYRVHYRDVKNGKLILFSEVYTTVRAAEYAIFLTRTYAATAPVDRSQVRAA